eukprot:130950_1
MADSNRKHIFNPGPSALPVEVLEKVQREILNWNGCGLSVLEMSHRSSEFGSIIDDARQDLRELLSVPENYNILFVAGGATTQFAAVPLNLLANGGKADYVCTGNWSEKSIKEAKKYGDIRVLYSGKDDGYIGTGTPDTWDVRTDAEYLYFCANETVMGQLGVEFESPPASSVPLVADMSSCLLSRPIDVSMFGLIFAGVQKNFGAAGLTVIIVRDDLVKKPHALCPEMLSYQTLVKSKSMFNTPPCYNIYVSGLVFKWIKRQGGLREMELRNTKKCSMIYGVVDESDGFYRCPVAVPSRSRMNVRLRIYSPLTSEVDQKLEELFLKEAADLGFVGLKGHRSINGLRISLYNAVPVESCRVLVEFMDDFRERMQTKCPTRQ